MTVLHLISSGGMYGAEAVILNLCSALNEGREHRGVVGVFANSVQPHLELHEAARKAGVESHVLPCRGQIDRHVPAAIRELVRQTGADVVHAHGYKADAYTCVALRGGSVPLISTCHNWLDDDRAVRLYGRLDRWVLRRFDGVVAVSDEVRKRLVGAGVRGERIRLIGNGIPLRRFADAQQSRAQRYAQDSTLKIGLVGRLSREKGIDVFLRAAAKVIRKRPEMEFVVAGDGPERSSLERLAKELGIAEKVFLLGRMDDMPRFYASVDVLAVASRKEGLPIAVLEGMASGLPVIATAVGDVPKVIRDGETGLLVRSDDPDGMAAAMEGMIEDPNLRRSLGASAQRLVAAEYSSGHMAAQYLDLYRDVLAARSEARTV
ncbi:MAG TPA: GT4 family glycosyltransferase PelF [Acidobacteriaceae bacterium]|jgi:glycosyltransferase involved in cell wall biosynthesis|nr:GT4 family glycosyltransferase PelF [Acidobacteriaceae bacterium]